MMFKTKEMIKKIILILLVNIGIILHAQDKIELYGIYEVEYKSTEYKATDNPVRDIDLVTQWQHESGYPTIKINGFYDGDGKGAPAGDVFKIRFCPTKIGMWKLVSIKSNDTKLNKQKEGLLIRCVKSEHPGFWIPDKENGNRWYMRSNGEHPYIIGNTFYTFLSEYFRGEPTGSNIKSDVLGNAHYLNKLRFATTGDIFPNPVEKPFLDNDGKPTDDAKYSHRPNPKWFSERVDLAVQLCYEQDVIADIILNGPDSEISRTALRPEENDFDYKPYLRYIAARYGSYPNVWICLSNEFDIKKPSYSEWDIVQVGLDMEEFLPYPTPLSVHGNQGNWKPRLNAGNWNDHVIIQNKIKFVNTAAEYNNLNYWIGGQKPVINDELAYEGAGDGWLEEDVIEAVLGAFMGGGYSSTGYKPMRKGGHYFAGNFNAEDHKSIDNILWFRQKIDQNIKFWKMQTAFITNATYKDGISGARSSIFYQMGKDFRVMEWPRHQYVLATNEVKNNIQAYLPNGKWEIKLFDVILKQEKLIAAEAEGLFEFSSPDSRAAFFVVTKVEE